jgi:hypothetical protein
MKHIFKILGVATVILFFAACHKVGDLPLYGKGTAVVLTSSTNTIAPVAADSNNSVVTFSWTNPAYQQDTSLYKFVVQIDSAGKNFANPITLKTVTGSYSGAVIAKDLNAILLAMGFAFNTTYTVDARVVSSYGNNNEAYYSNVLQLQVTPYKIPPKIPVPAKLYLVGDINGWNNSGSLPIKYQFSKIDETTYAGIFNFPGGGGYKLIQELGNWDTQFHMVTGGSESAGDFVQENADPTFPGPAAAGWYRVTVDFQHGKYKVTASPARQAVPPANLYIVGDLNGWNNSAGLNPIYKFALTGADPFTYALNVHFPGGGGYKLIQELGNWGSQFHMITGGTASFGQFEQADSDPGFPGPAAGDYKVTVNMAAGYYWVTPQ